MLTLSKINKSYSEGGKKLQILRGADFTLEPGKITALIGPSGSGKTTLLQIAGLLDVPDSGKIVIDGMDVTGLSDRKRTKIRLNTLGFVYQFHHLLPEFSALENVALPQRIAGKSHKEATKRAKSLLQDFGLKARLHHGPAELSGGEQQRVAIARALANQPKLLLADEPTGNLDPKTADKVFALFLDYAKSHDLTALLVTHNVTLAAHTHQTLKLDNGAIA